MSNPTKPDDPRVIVAIRLPVDLNLAGKISTLVAKAFPEAVAGGTVDQKWMIIFHREKPAE